MPSVRIIGMTDISRSAFQYHSDLPGAEAVPLLPDDQFVLEATGLPEEDFGRCHTGKVRDVYEQDDRVLLVATDRFSSFDRQIAVVPHSGAVVTAVSGYWFERTADIVANHMVDMPDPNVIVAQKYEVMPVEVVVRGFMTGVTSTSLWSAYRQGRRDFDDFELPDGLYKNDELPEPVVTPTTKFEAHDRPLPGQEAAGLPGMDRRSWEQVREIALALYGLGRQVAAERGLILVDTKYEFGRGPDGPVLIDEIHTPDSSRYWHVDDYAARHDYLEEPDNYDKEYLRLWMRGRCDPYADEALPIVPDDIIAEMGRRYIRIYERLLRQPFRPDFTMPVRQRIRRNLGQ